MLSFAGKERDAVHTADAAGLQQDGPHHRAITRAAGRVATGDLANAQDLSDHRPTMLKGTLSVTNVRCLLGLMVVLGGACGSKSASSPCEGQERCVCYANMTCNAGLACLSNLCVALSGGAGTGVGGMSTGVGGAVGTGGALAAGGSNGATGGALGVGGMSVGTGGTAGAAACVGQQGCACYPNLTCNATLTCAGGVCIASSGAGGATAGTGGIPGTGGSTAPNLIKNGDFTMGKTYWDLTPQAGEVYSYSYTGGEYCVRNESSSMWLSFSLGYPPTPTDAFPIEVGATYTLSYRVKLTGPATVKVKIGQASPPYTELAPTVPFTDSITGLGEYQTFSHQLQFTTGDPTAGLVFNTELDDYAPITICFDDVRLAKN